MSEDDLERGDRLVRPYTLTRGRTTARRGYLPLEALVRAVGAPTLAVGAPERGRIVALVRDKVLSVVELSAHLSLPIGVIRVLVGDLADERLVVVHGASSDSVSPADNLEVLESVLDGISSL